MKKKVNSNYICSKLFADELVKCGVKYVCISPGSRSTPLVHAFIENKKIKSFVNIDERSSAFFALGISKSSNIPAVIVTTSGTAVAELYPAIVEAYQSRVPLIICTADRPAYLRNSGTNQTINQENIFRNHIRWFMQMDLPSVEKISLINFRKTAAQAFYISTKSDNGPVHINFPFEKPLGPNTFNTEIDKRIFRLAKKEKISISTGTNSFSITGLKSISKKIVTSKKGWIIAGPMELNQFLIKKIILLSELTGFPVLADGISNLRWINSERIFSNYNLFYKSTTFFEKNIPELIIQFGRTPTSMILEKFFQNKKISIYSIDKFGDRFDSGNKSVKIIKADPGEFCDNVLNQIKKENNDTPTYFEQIQFAESTSEKIKNRYLSTKNFKLEPVLLYNIIRNLPAKTRVIIGNSLPVRDLDNFIKENHEIEFYFNRGASGIDGVTSTAAGVASQGVTTVLITGDLSFLHDLNALMVMKKYPLPLTIFVINNNGGAIFNSLPAASGNKLIDKFFITPHNLKIGEIVTSFGLKYVEVKSIDELTYISMNVNEKKACAVVEIKTNPVKSKKFREKIFTKVEKQITRGTL